MRWGVFKEGDFDREDGGTREREDELEHEVDSGQISMYTGVRVSGSCLCLDDMAWLLLVKRIYGCLSPTFKKHSDEEKTSARRLPSAKDNIRAMDFITS
jgi:hypothetical protein